MPLYFMLNPILYSPPDCFEKKTVILSNAENTLNLKFLNNLQHPTSFVIKEGILREDLRHNGVKVLSKDVYMCKQY
jgi:hypothetical protein